MFLMSVAINFEYDCNQAWTEHLLDEPMGNIKIYCDREYSVAALKLSLRQICSQILLIYIYLLVCVSLFNYPFIKGAGCYSTRIKTAPTRNGLQRVPASCQS